ncbi:catalase [Exilibacterium tricleocarpae]|uniref:Catalase n=1 Tax=Exilibacterium tricleocarpae TaxID=2591008 RepID=A0A545T3N5_9GAMM|nr:putative metalloprotease CJM1_0395 family protein [Exilibacterium tricleocarpae]TQV71831.1 catalase [Exilibacterium tricleocarpae]
MINPNLPPNFANNFSPYSTVDKSSVGEESAELRGSPLKAVEIAAESGRLQNRRDPGERPAEAEERLRVRGRDEGERETARERDEQARRLQEDQREIRELAARDREVRAHEQAHAAVGGQYAGAPRYTLQRGPDGVGYAVAGEVSIDTSRVAGDPEATIAKAQQVQRAALAPSDPSPQDRRVAAAAAQLQLDAQVELRELQQQEARLRAEQLAGGGDGAQEAGQEAARAGQPGGGEAAANSPVEAGNRNVDINQRLIDSGAREADNPAGALLDEVV